MRVEDVEDWVCPVLLRFLDVSTDLVPPGRGQHRDLLTSHNLKDKISDGQTGGGKWGSAPPEEVLPPPPEEPEGGGGKALKNENPKYFLKNGICIVLLIAILYNMTPL